MAYALTVKIVILRATDDGTFIITRPSQFIKKKIMFAMCYPIIFREYPLFAQAMKKRPGNYMESVRLIRHPPAGVRVFEIAPPPDIDVGRMTTDIQSLRAAYQSGRDHGRKFMDAHAP